MKWFLALNHMGSSFPRYAEMVKVAVHTAMMKTSLSPYILYDGPENDLTSWLRHRGVIIFPCRSYLYESLRQIAEARNRPAILATGAGAFLRLELPRLALEAGVEDQYVLYTDCDVIFLQDVRELEELEPHYFAVAPESNPRDYFHMNTGVMVMNLEALREDDEDFRRYTSDHLEQFVDASWDQAAYHGFYTSHVLRNTRLDFRLRSRTRRLRRTRWDRLSPVYNWKPYWGDYSGARIVHFHGPKPHDLEFFLSTPRPDLIPVRHLASGKYEELCNIWYGVLAEV